MSSEQKVKSRVSRRSPKNMTPLEKCSISRESHMINGEESKPAQRKREDWKNAYGQGALQKDSLLVNSDDVNARLSIDSRNEAQCQWRFTNEQQVFDTVQHTSHLQVPSNKEGHSFYLTSPSTDEGIVPDNHFLGEQKQISHNGNDIVENNLGHQSTNQVNDCHIFLKNGIRYSLDKKHCPLATRHDINKFSNSDSGTYNKQNIEDRDLVKDPNGNYQQQKMNGRQRHFYLRKQSHSDVTSNNHRLPNDTITRYKSDMKRFQHQQSFDAHYQANNSNRNVHLSRFQKQESLNYRNADNVTSKTSSSQSKTSSTTYLENPSTVTIERPPVSTTSNKHKSNKTLPNCDIINNAADPESKDTDLPKQRITFQTSNPFSFFKNNDVFATSEDQSKHLTENNSSLYSPSSRSSRTCSTKTIIADALSSSIVATATGSLVPNNNVLTPKEKQKSLTMQLMTVGPNDQRHVQGIVEDILCEMGEERIVQYKEAFGKFDKESSGIISSKQLRHLLRTLGHNPSDAELTELVNQVDMDENGKIDFNEFIIMIGYFDKANNESEDLSNIFRVFDRDGKDGIDVNELRRIWEEYLLEMAPIEELEDMINTIDNDGNGEINRNEMLELLSLR